MQEQKRPHIPSEAFGNGISLALSIRSPDSIKSFAVNLTPGSMSMKFGSKYNLCRINDDEGRMRKEVNERSAY